MPTINTEALDKYNMYTDEQLANEFLENKRSLGEGKLEVKLFTSRLLNTLTVYMEENGENYKFSRIINSAKLIQVIYTIYRRHRCDYPLNVMAFCEVLEKFARTNTTAISDKELTDYFLNFFTPLLERAYAYKNLNGANNVL